MVLRRIESAGRSAELLRHDDPGTPEVDPLPSQRIQLPRPQPGERGNLQPRRERRTGKVARVLDDLPHLLLGRWLLIAPARPSRDAELLKRVAVDQPARLHRRRVIEHRRQSLNRPGTPTTGKPRRDDLIPHTSDRHTAVTLYEALGLLTTTDIARLLRAREQWVGRPPLPELPHQPAFLYRGETESKCATAPSSGDTPASS